MLYYENLKKKKGILSMAQLTITDSNWNLSLNNNKNNVILMTALVFK